MADEGSGNAMFGSPTLRQTPFHACIANVSGIMPHEKPEATVLVVEDETMVRNAIVDALVELGYNALEAEDGPAGLRVVESEESFALLLTDVGLPGIDGRQLAEAARALRPDLKVLFITGYAQQTMPGNHAFDADTQTVAKPFSLDVLAATVRAMIDA